MKCQANPCSKDAAWQTEKGMYLCNEHFELRIAVLRHPSWQNRARITSKKLERG